MGLVGWPTMDVVGHPNDDTKESLYPNDCMEKDESNMWLLKFHKPASMIVIKNMTMSPFRVVIFIKEDLMGTTKLRPE